VQSVATTTMVLNSNPVRGEVYSIQHYVIKIISDLRQIGGFSPGAPVSCTNKTDHHDITDMLLKVLTTTSQTKSYFYSQFINYHETDMNVIFVSEITRKSILNKRHFKS
jgi:hypothetical protein